MEDLIICLKDFGCRDITIGEGSVVIKKGIGTDEAFAGLGYTALEKNTGPGWWISTKAKAKFSRIRGTGNC
ncbi:MAG: hypothetical protein R2861_09855 [Desulfobacterales bacterium]